MIAAGNLALSFLEPPINFFNYVFALVLTLPQRLHFEPTLSLSITALRELPETEFSCRGIGASATLQVPLPGSFVSALINVRALEFADRSVRPRGALGFARLVRVLRIVPQFTRHLTAVHSTAQLT